MKPGEIVESTGECNVGDGAPALPSVSQSAVARIQSRRDEHLAKFAPAAFEQLLHVAWRDLQMCRDLADTQLRIGQIGRNELLRGGKSCLPNSTLIGIE